MIITRLLLLVGVHKTLPAILLVSFHFILNTIINCFILQILDFVAVKYAKMFQDPYRMFLMDLMDLIDVVFPDEQTRWKKTVAAIM